MSTATAVRCVYIQRHPSELVAVPGGHVHATPHASDMVRLTSLGKLRNRLCRPQRGAFLDR